MTDTMKYIHNYQEHSIPVPIADLATDTSGTDKILLRELQMKERDYKVIYDSDLGQTELDESLSTQQKQFMFNHEFILGEDGCYIELIYQC